MPGGRPEEYTLEIAERICAELATGKSLKSVCAQEWAPGLTTVFSWLNRHEEFPKLYARAKQESADAMAEEILDIADDGSNDFMTITKGHSTYEVENKEVTNRSRLRVDTRKWLMAKMKPKRYGDKLDVTSGNKPIPLLNALSNNNGNPQGGIANKAN